VEADGLGIWITGPSEVMDRLIEEDLARVALEEELDEDENGGDWRWKRIADEECDADGESDDMWCGGDECCGDWDEELEVEVL